ncbi:unnamed protein product [Gongylonema pulchrum]|uniref:DEP domain-containing protein n=1 Tax=Gongylonema pulchrum TaxID=637853 RepID=A0A183EQ56_9BILA|nr:unnamed protein product [Gongylonema pulchrum]
MLILLQLLMLILLQWNGMLRRFRTAIPVEHCNSFIRKSMDSRPVKQSSKTNCSKLLAIYLEMGLFYTVQCSNEPFKESELYRFSVERSASTTVLVRRAASFNEQYKSAHKSDVPELAATAENKESEERLKVNNSATASESLQTQNPEDLQGVNSKRSSSQTLQYDNENALLSQ